MSTLMDAAFYGNLMETSVSIFAVFLAVALAPDTYLKERKWSDRLRSNILRAIVRALYIPATMVIMAPVFIMASFASGTFDLAYVGFCLVFYGCILGGMIIPFAFGMTFAIGYVYRLTEKRHFEQFLKETKNDQKDEKKP